VEEHLIIPGHAMVLNGRILPMIATVVKSIPNQVDLLIGLPVIYHLNTIY
jgi:hypothetical protein